MLIKQLLKNVISALVSLKYYFQNITSTNEIESVLLIDEFDATLHPSLQFKLLDIFRTYSTDYKIQNVSESGLSHTIFVRWLQTYTIHIEVATLMSLTVFNQAKRLKNTSSLVTT